MTIPRPRTLLLTIPAVTVNPGQTRGPAETDVPDGAMQVEIEVDSSAWAAGQEVDARVELSSDSGSTWSPGPSAIFRKDDMAPFGFKGYIGVAFASGTAGATTRLRGSVTNLVGPSFQLAAALYSLP